jgi:hypothetical protein
MCSGNDGFARFRPGICSMQGKPDSPVPCQSTLHMARQFSLPRRRIAWVLTAIVSLAGASLAGATGYWNVPGSCCQWLGCGYGGGYHAPFILGPLTCECLHPPNETRLPSAPNPYACVPRYNDGGGGNGCGADRPTMMTPSVQPAPAPAPSPEPLPPPAARRSVIFAPPVQR